jgi:SAM-dependent methyltransferase
VLNYDDEAERYDATRGGDARAKAAADAILELLPTDTRTLVDVGCGTGIVTQYVVRDLLSVIGIDPSPGMAGKARERISVVNGSAERLPFADGSIDAVSLIWILHLIPDPRPALAEIARVLRPGGTLITTVDKDAGHDVGSDIDARMRPFRSARPSDGFFQISWYAREHGLIPAGETAFAGHGMGLTPRAAADRVRDGYFASAMRIKADAAESLARDLESLQQPLTPRPEPVFRLVAFHNGHGLASNYYAR